MLSPSTSARRYNEGGAGTRLIKGRGECDISQRNLPPSNSRRCVVRCPKRLACLADVGTQRWRDLAIIILSAAYAGCFRKDDLVALATAVFRNKRQGESR